MPAAPALQAFLDDAKASLRDHGLIGFYWGPVDRHKEVTARVAAHKVAVDGLVDTLLSRGRGGLLALCVFDLSEAAERTKAAVAVSRTADEVAARQKGVIVAHQGTASPDWSRYCLALVGRLQGQAASAPTTSPG